MPKKSNKSSKKGMRSLVLDSGSKWVNEVERHINDSAKEHGVEGHQLDRMTPEQFYKEMKNNREAMIEYVGSLDYIGSTGSPNYRKYDTEIHKFIADYKKPEAVFQGICHGGQQAAAAHGAEIEKTEYVHRGERTSKIKKEHPVLKGVSYKGEMTAKGHHKWIIPSDKAGSQLEIIAEAESPHTGQKFVEFYKVKGEEIYGGQFHPELGDGKVIKNLFKRAYDNKNKSVGFEKKSNIIKHDFGKDYEKKEYRMTG